MDQNEEKTTAPGDNPETDAPVGENEEKKFDLLSEIFDVVEIFAVAVAFTFLCFNFVFRVAMVDGSSMNQTLIDRERVLVWELGYQPKTGDIVVCQSERYGYETPLVKRVIATGGQTVSIDFENWKVTVDGKTLDEPYVYHKNNRSMDTEDYYAQYTLDENGAFTVPAGKVFVLGDNRNGSSDSRYGGIGLIDEQLVTGHVIFRILPFDKIGAVS
ncbi:MAG: signal peptidase I [Lachnospiraceae bacterium]|nr:signal peptidase I [Lachnospiraceae bacterium]